MDIPWGSDLAYKFITNVGLITTNGPNGPDIMACEWTHHVSYSPGLIAICVNRYAATNENIKKTKEFGVSICAEDQNVISSISGKYSGKDYDKVKMLKELGYMFTPAEKINVVMVDDSAAQFECKLKETLEMGSHTIFIGEVVAARDNEERKPLGFHAGKYWVLEKNPEKPSDSERSKIDHVARRFLRK